MNAGARGVEILISGKVPSSRAKTWRFYMGYLKKSGDVAVSGVHTAYAQAKLKTGIVGVQVRIMPSTTALPDDVTYITAEVQDMNAKKAEKLAEEAAEKEEAKAKKKTSKSKTSSKPRKIKPRPRH